MNGVSNATEKTPNGVFASEWVDFGNYNPMHGYEIWYAEYGTGDWMP